MTYQFKVETVLVHDNSCLLQYFVIREFDENGQEAAAVWVDMERMPEFMTSLNEKYLSVIRPVQSLIAS